MNFILYGSFYGERYVVYDMASLESLFGLNCPFTYLFSLLKNYKTEFSYSLSLVIFLTK